MSVSKKYTPEGEPYSQGIWVIQKERRETTGTIRYRLTNTRSGAPQILSDKELVDLADLSDLTCDEEAL